MTPKSVFVTGASAGIGKAICEIFAANGWKVGAADIDTEGLTKLQNTLGKETCSTYLLDVTSSEHWQTALESFCEERKTLDLLINNAGILASGEFQTIPLSFQHKIIDINVKGVMNGCYTAFPFLKKTPGAKVINLASASAIYGQPSLAAYSASKFAVKGLTEALNLEWEKDDIYVMDVLPLFVQTSMVTDMKAESIKNLGVKLTAEDVAQTIYKAASTAHRLAKFNRKNKVHWTVGTLTWLMYMGANLSPDWLNRAMNKWLTRTK